jgi:hypothetical protein
VPADGLAKWDGTSWSAVALGPYNSISDLEVFDDGGGPALYAAGSLWTVGGVIVNNIAKWDGSSWSALGSGTDGNAYSLAVFDDGSGPALYVGGDFAHAGGLLVNGIAKWKGGAWSALGIGLVGPYGEVGVPGSMAVFDDGAGQKLFVSGGFSSAGEVERLELVSGWHWDISRCNRIERVR